MSFNTQIERQSDGYTILHILGTEHKHSGEIKCTSFLESNPINSVTRYTELTVLPVEQTERILELDAGTEQPDIPAYITRGPEDCTVLVGGTVALDIQFGGYPQPDVKWMRAGRAITECDTIEIHTGDGHSRLLLTEITADQSGKYTVEVTNSYNMDMAAASVAVEGVPDPPGGKPSVSKGPDRVAIAWCGPPYDGGCMVTGFILEMQHNDDEWREIASVVDSLAYTVKNLSYGSKYQFRVRAENVHGLSEPSQPSDEIIHEKPCENVKSVDIHIRPGGEFRSRFDILEELGKGRFGIVHKVVDRDSGQTCAAKIIKCIKAKDRTKVQEEISLMQALKHPKLLQLAAAFESAREIVMVMEYITGGELFERVVADDFTLTEKDCVLFMRQICEGVEYMHQKSIVHLDLKPENIMCHTRTSHQIKIIDFGLAQKLAPNTPVRVLFGTPEFIPPEIINYEPIGFQSDMWSVGVICYVLLSGLSPFMGDSDVDTFANITRADYDFDDEAFDSVTVEAKDFISSLLIHRKESRLTASACMQAPWLAQENDNLSCVTICTDKLKKFIIRRKWQKTGNAIRALGRMATLSANSRRNSSTSAQNSPRPSISGCLITNLPSRMSSVNEEDDDSDAYSDGKLRVHPTKFKNRICTERSDSGFSECSNCSAQSTVCSCTSSLLDKTNLIVEETHSDVLDLNISLPHDILQTKLALIAKAQNQKIDVTNDDRDDIEKVIIIEVPVKSTPKIEEIPRVISPTKSSSFSTIEMRKKSLEHNFLKDTLSPIKSKSDKNLSEKNGKVSQLKDKFSTLPRSKPSSIKSSIDSLFSSSDDGNIKTTRLSSRKSSPDPEVYAPNRFKTDESNRTAEAAAPGYARTPVRLSGRIKEVTDRLSQPKHTQSPVSTPTQNLNKDKTIPNAFKTGSQKDNFKKISAFWER